MQLIQYFEHKDALICNSYLCLGFGAFLFHKNFYLWLLFLYYILKHTFGFASKSICNQKIGVGLRKVLIFVDGNLVFFVPSLNFSFEVKCKIKDQGVPKGEVFSPIL